MGSTQGSHLRFSFLTNIFRADINLPNRTNFLKVYENFYTAILMNKRNIKESKKSNIESVGFITDSSLILHRFNKDQKIIRKEI